MKVKHMKESPVDGRSYLRSLPYGRAFTLKPDGEVYIKVRITGNSTPLDPSVTDALNIAMCPPGDPRHVAFEARTGSLVSIPGDLVYPLSATLEVFSRHGNPKEGE